jgi:hypothetical protein
MAVRISTPARNAAVDAIVALIGAGAGAGVLHIYSRAQPAGLIEDATTAYADHRRKSGDLDGPARV